MNQAKIRRACTAAAIALLLSVGAPAATIVVNDIGDALNSPGCATTGIGTCTLRDAITFANANPGSDSIHFAIIGAGPHTIKPATELPAIGDSVEIDGYSQPGAVANTLAEADNAMLQIVLDGTDAPSGANGLVISGSGSTIRGLNIVNFVLGAGILITGPGSSNAVEGNYVGTNIAGTGAASNAYGILLSAGTQFNRIGGGSAAERNIVSGNPLGLTLEGSLTSNNLIIGNFIGPQASGLFGMRSSGGLIIHSPANQIGATTAGERNVVSGNIVGLTVSGPDATDNLIIGNYIGANARGTDQLFNSNAGVDIEDGASRNIFGGAAEGAGNVVVAGSVSVVAGGMFIGGASTVGNRIQGNRFGLLPDGSAIGGGAIGITDASDTLIGGSGPGEGNEIAYGLASIAMERQTPGACLRNRIQRNSIHGHAELGISLSTGTITPNDPLDTDDGPNGLQNYPDIEVVTPQGISGTLRSAPDGDYTVEFFSNKECGLDGFGEGETFLASIHVVTDDAGNAAFALAVPIPAGRKITATATDSSGNTSEFSKCVEVAAPALAVDSVAGPSSDGDGVFEPGETASIDPTWPNPQTTSLALTGTAVNLAGPAGPAYTIPDGAADYGIIPPLSRKSCADTPDCYAMTIEGSRPSVHWDATFVEVLSDASQKTWTLHLGDSFADVSRSYLFYRKIETLLHAGITTGCSPTAYCPDDPITRDQVALFLARAIAGGAALPVSGTVDGRTYDCTAGGVSLFIDVMPTDTACRAVHYLSMQNVTKGCAPSRYCPTQQVARGEMAGLVAKSIKAPGGGGAVPLGYEDSGTGLSYSCLSPSPGTHFLDVSVSNPFCKHVHFLWAKGFVGGCAADLFCPLAAVTRGEMAKFLSNAFGLELYGP